MRQIDHFLVGGAPAASRFSDIMDPNNGGVQGRVVLGDETVLDQAVASGAADADALLKTSLEDGKTVQELLDRTRVGLTT